MHVCTSDHVISACRMECLCIGQICSDILVYIPSGDMFDVVHNILL